MELVELPTSEPAEGSEAEAPSFPADSLPLDPRSLEFADATGDACARRTWAAGHVIQLVLFLDFLLLFALHGWLAFLAAVLATAVVLFTAAIIFRLAAVLISVVSNPQITVSSAEVDAVERTELPRYTILVPLYQEANIAGSIVHQLQSLRYPREKLDIKLLLEADDQVTVDAVDALDLGDEFDRVLIDPSYPRTKPKACNLGLDRAKGDYVVIFDAEDRPDPDQLLKVVHAFRHCDRRVACMQAKLNYGNARENFITRSFALEYTLWFDFYLPGLQRIGAPIPLGGTSNHFPTSVLRDLGGWDPFNVTEDCDLGIRLAVRGFETRIIDSTTWEEANSRLGNWIRQRSRWSKGYLQTHLVHTKSIRRLVASLGLRRAAFFFLTTGGNVVMQLLCILLWTSSLVYGGLLLADVIAGRDVWTVVAGSRDEFRLAWKMLYMDTGEHPLWSKVSLVGFVSSIFMLLANVALIMLGVIACFRRGYGDLWGTALLSPVYWLMGSVAAWKGAIQLVRRPHYWEKTTHGISRHTQP